MMESGIDILLVEDTDGDAELAIRILRREHPAINIFTATDGEEALDFLFCRGPFASRSFTNPPKVVFLDLKLPKLDGVEVLEQAKRDDRTKTIPIVILTSSKEESDLIRSYDLGANSYVQKPVNFEQFSRTLKLLGQYWMVINQLPVHTDAAEWMAREK
jgi:CheY-like chemotaxis protein